MFQFLPSAYICVPHYAKHFHLRTTLQVGAFISILHVKGRLSSGEMACGTMRHAGAHPLLAVSRLVRVTSDLCFMLSPAHA